MLFLSIAGGIAFSYKDFMNDGERKGSMIGVIIENWKSFSNDYRLIKPKSGGFTSSSHSEIIEKNRLSSIVKTIQIDMKGIELQDKLITNYNVINKFV